MLISKIVFFFLVHVFVFNYLPRDATPSILHKQRYYAKMKQHSLTGRIVASYYRLRESLIQATSVATFEQR